ncbi:hypothetical protein [Roseicella aquatilis]|uniref:Uncharacterized protein n=1 Tax=Roseicella aquatilis TaxID=2527868 RepID=A0A4V2WM71_9PROT|nr:hypothetical protein [Roseicella aquatilis]TCZ66730.1 hypothetical protein EXY23_01065 [Roseicella aquatilis]
MTREQARALAIEMGALRPQDMSEGAAVAWLSASYHSFAETPKAQSRLEAWTAAILAGTDPRTGRALERELSR